MWDFDTMNRKMLGGRPSYLVLAWAATALLAAGCNRGQTAATTAPPLDALPLTTNTTGSADPAPLAAALPYAAPARIARLAHPEEGYAYLDRAYAASDGYADAPPDYAVDYEGERPWIWRGGDNSERVVERTPQGLRYYYYEPGADEPYLIQDPDYGYAYSDGQLVAVYGQDGQIEPYEVQRRRADQAGRYLAWAAGLYAASLHQQRQAVEQGHWREQQAYIAGQRNAWAQQQQLYPAWNDYHQAHAQEETAHWAPERDRRQAEIVRYGGPQGGGGGGPQTARYQAGDPGRAYPAGQGANAGFQGVAQAQNDGQFRQGGQAYGRPPGYPAAPPSGYGYDPNAARGAPAQAQADRRAGFDQRTADIQAQRQNALAAHMAQVQAQQAQVRDAQARNLEARTAEARNAEAHNAEVRSAEAQRQATLQQARAQQEVQRQGAERAHAAQMQAMASQRMQAQAAEGQRQATLQQARAQQEAQHQATLQAHAAQASEARAQAEGQRRAAEQQAQAANAQRQAAEQQAHAAQSQAQAQAHAAEQQARMAQAAQPHPAPSHGGGPPPHQDGPHGDHEHHGEQR